MARIPLRAVADMDEGQRAAYDRFPSNLTRTLQLAPPRLARALPETANALRACGLDPSLREAVILRVAALSGSAYERVQHLGQAVAAGWSPEQITAIEAGETSSLGDPVASVLPLVDGAVASPHVPGALVDAARTVLSDPELVTVLLLVGHYTTVALLIGVLEVEPDDHADPWTHEH